MSSNLSDDRTIARDPITTGYDSGDPVSDVARLPMGARLGEFEVTGFVGEGGFSIVYEAWDHSLERQIALKEYMPSSLATRRHSSHVHPRSGRHQETFEAGLKSFVNEGKLLAQFDHPALVKVYRFWEANGTAYMVMPLYEGVTLKEAVRALPEPPDEAWLLDLLEPLTEALMVIHREQCFHRDIAPDNVLLLSKSSQPLLLDFGAARRVIGDKTQALTVILKPGYAPFEQYAEDSAMRQGPWTDVYALAAVVHWAMLGRTPPVAVARVINDAYQPLAPNAGVRWSPRFLAAIDAALAVLPENRTASIEDFRKGIGLGASVQPPRSRRVGVDDERTVIQSQTAVANVPVVPPEAAQPAQAAAALRLLQADQSDPRPVDDRVHAAGPPTPSTRQLPRSALLVAAVLLTGVGVGTWILRERAPVASDVKVTPPTTTGAIVTPDESVPAAMPPRPLPTEPAETMTPLPALEPLPSTPLPHDIAPRTTKPVAPKATVTPPNAAECARVLQRLSLGESSPELIEQMKSLRCR